MATRAEKAAAKAQGIADAWNAAHPVGTQVRYWRGLKEGEPSGTGATRHAAQVMSGHVSVWIEGCSGSVALTHVEVVS